MTTQAFQSPHAFQPSGASFGSNTSPLSVSGAAGLPSPPGIDNAMLATYASGFSAPTPPSSSASLSSNPGSPQSGFQPSNDFGTSVSTVGASRGVCRYGVPMTDKEAMMQHFAPTISQDRQI